MDIKFGVYEFGMNHRVAVWQSLGNRGILLYVKQEFCRIGGYYAHIVVFLRQFHNSKPLLYLVFLSIEKGVPPQILEVIGDETNTRE